VGALAAADGAAVLDVGMIIEDVGPVAMDAMAAVGSGGAHAPAASSLPGELSMYLTS
jgi:hypothetical protein